MKRIMKIFLVVAMILCVMPTLENEIKAESLTITPPSVTTWTYDGQVHYGAATVSENGATITYSPSTNGTHYSAYAGEVPRITNVGTLWVKAKATKSGFADAEIQYTLTVTKKLTPITITTDSDNKNYDGTPLTAGGYTYTQDVLCSGDQLTVTTEGTITNFGSTKNSVKSYMVKNGDEDRTECYTFTDHVLGTLTINSIIDNSKSNIVVDSTDGTKLTKAYVPGNINEDCVIDFSGLTIRTTSTTTIADILLATDPTTGRYIPADVTGGGKSIVITRKSNSSVLSALSDYKIENGSVKITISKEFIKTLPLGDNELSIVMKDNSGLSYSFDLNIPIKYPASTTNNHVDTTCEAVIGPRWHWNEKTGTCVEDYSVINTATK